MFALATLSCNGVVGGPPAYSNSNSHAHQSLLLQHPHPTKFPSFFTPPSLLVSKSMVLSKKHQQQHKTCVAVQPNQILDTSSEKEVTKKYYFVIANAKFMLDEEEHFQEQLFERRRYYGERNKEIDFWLVIEPKFLDKFPNISSRLKRPAVALVSTNGTWITFMKLRLDRVLSESYEADSLEEALASNPTNLEFKKPESWVAPYPKYESGWWEPFLFPGSNNPNA